MIYQPNHLLAVDTPESSFATSLLKTAFITLSCASTAIYIAILSKLLFSGTPFLQACVSSLFGVWVIATHPFDWSSPPPDDQKHSSAQQFWLVVPDESERPRIDAAAWWAELAIGGRPAPWVGHFMVVGEIDLWVVDRFHPSKEVVWEENIPGLGDRRYMYKGDEKHYGLRKITNKGPHFLPHQLVDAIDKGGFTAYQPNVLSLMASTVRRLDACLDTVPPFATIVVTAWSTGFDLNYGGLAVRPEITMILVLTNETPSDEIIADSKAYTATSGVAISFVQVGSVENPVRGRRLADLRLMARFLNRQDITIIICNSRGLVGAGELTLTTTACWEFDRPASLAMASVRVGCLSHYVCRANGDMLLFSKMATLFSIVPTTYGIDEVAFLYGGLVSINQHISIDPHTTDNPRADYSVDCISITGVTNGTFDTLKVDRVSCQDYLDRLFVQDTSGAVRLWSARARMNPRMSVGITHQPNRGVVDWSAGSLVPIPLLAFTPEDWSQDDYPEQNPKTAYRYTETCSGLRSFDADGVAPYCLTDPYSTGWFGNASCSVPGSYQDHVMSVVQMLTDLEWQKRRFGMVKCFVAAASAGYEKQVSLAVDQLDRVNADRGQEFDLIIFICPEFNIPTKLVDHPRAHYIRVPILNRSRRSLMYWRNLPAFFGSSGTKFCSVNIKANGMDIPAICWDAFDTPLDQYCYNPHGAYPVYMGAQYFRGSIIRSEFNRYVTMMHDFAGTYGPDELWWLSVGAVALVPNVPELTDINRFMDIDCDFAYVRVDRGDLRRIISYQVFDRFHRKTVTLSLEKWPSWKSIGPATWVRPSVNQDLDELIVKYKAGLLSDRRVSINVIAEGANQAKKIEFISRGLNRVQRRLANDLLITISPFGTSGDWVPLMFIARILSAAGSYVQVASPVTRTEGRDTLLSVISGYGEQALPAVVKCRAFLSNVAGLHVVPPCLGTQTSLKVELAPEQHEITPIDPNISINWVNECARWLVWVTAVERRIKVRISANHWPRSSNGLTQLKANNFDDFGVVPSILLLTAQTVINKPLGWLRGVTGSNADVDTSYYVALGSEDTVIDTVKQVQELPTCDHEKFLRGHPSPIVCFTRGNHGLVETVLATGHTVVVVGDNPVPDRGWLKRLMRGEQTLIDNPCHTVLRDVVTRLPSYHRTYQLSRPLLSFDIFVGLILTNARWFSYLPSTFAILMNRSSGFAYIAGSNTFVEALFRFLMGHTSGFSILAIQLLVTPTMFYVTARLGHKWMDYCMLVASQLTTLMWYRPEFIVTIATGGSFLAALSNAFTTYLVLATLDLASILATACLDMFLNGSKRDGRIFYRKVAGTGLLGWHLGFRNIRTGEVREFDTYTVGDIGEASGVRCDVRPIKHNEHYLPLNFDWDALPYHHEMTHNYGAGLHCQAYVSLMVMVMNDKRLWLALAPIIGLSLITSTLITITMAACVVGMWVTAGPTALYLGTRVSSPSMLEFVALLRDGVLAMG
jgi:hypothetical protein